MRAEDTTFAAALRRRLDASKQQSYGDLHSIADYILHIARSRHPELHLRGCSEELLDLVMTLASRGDYDRARILLLATARFLMPTRRVETLRNIVSRDVHTAFDFARATGFDIERLGMDGTTIVQMLRARIDDADVGEKDVRLCLDHTRGRDRRSVITLGLRRFPTSSWLWQMAGGAFTNTRKLREAARAYECSLLVDGVGGAPHPVEVDELLARMDEAGCEIDSAGKLETTLPDEWNGSGRTHLDKLPPLANLAILHRHLLGTAAARETVAQHAGAADPLVAALAFARAGAGDDAVRVLVESLRHSTTAGDVRAWPTVLTLGRVLLALGRTVDAVATVRVMLQWRSNVDEVLRWLLGHGDLRQYVPYRAGWADPLGVTPEEVRDAAIVALLRDQRPPDSDREEARVHVQTMECGSLEERVTALAALRRLGAHAAAVVRERIAEGSPRLRLRLGWLLEQWAWESAEKRLCTAHGLQGPLPPSRDGQSLFGVAGDPASRREDDWSQASLEARDAIDHMRALELDEAHRLVHRLCEERIAPYRRIAPAIIADLVDLLLAEGDVDRARRLLDATVDDAATLIRFRDILDLDERAAFDRAVARRDDRRPFEGFGLSDADAARLTGERLDAGSLPLDTVLWILSHLDSDGRISIIRPALRRFPTSPTLLAIAAEMLLRAKRPRSALRLFEKSASIRHEATALYRSGTDARAEDDPDQRPGVRFEAVQVLAGYPPRIASREERDARRDGPGQWAMVDAGAQKPLLVNVAILRCERDGRARALNEIHRYAGTQPALFVAAALRAVGDTDAACLLLEREVSRGRDVLDGIVAAYVGTERMRDAIAIAVVILGDFARAREHIDILLSVMINQWDEDPPDEVLAYELRFDFDAAVDAAVDHLVRTQDPSSRACDIAREVAERVGADDFSARVQALAQLQELGPCCSPALAEAIPRLNDCARQELRAVLETWTWEAEVARMQNRLQLHAQSSDPPTTPRQKPSP